MFGRILVPVDSTSESEAILAEAQRIAAPHAEVVLLHVIPDTPLSAADAVRAPEHVHAYLERLAGRLRGVRARVFVDAGDPGDRIVRVALALNTQLIAMTTHARHGIPRLVLGSVAEHVMREASLPVLLVRPGLFTPARPIKRILVPLDDSARSARMLDVVRPWAAATGAEVVLLHVVPAESQAPLEVAGGTGLERRTADPRRMYEEMSDRLEKAGVASWPVVSRGDAVSEILQQAKALDVDVIAMATHGRTGLERALVGSVAEGVLRGADRPVLMLRATRAPRLQESGSAR